MNVLLVLNDAPYGSERTYNGLRLAGALSRQQGAGLKIFLIGDAVGCSKAGQKVPSGYYSVETMLKAAARHGAAVGVCGSCLDARAIGDGELVEGAHRGSLEELAAWTLEADKVLTF